MLGSGDGSFIVKLRGLPFSTTVEDVLDFLRGVNVVNEKEGVHLTEVRPGRPSGECYVEVQSQADVDEALKKDKENMGKRYIEVFSTDRQDMDWALNAMNQSENGFSGIPNLNDDMGIVKLRGLPFGCSKEEIIQFFDGLTVAPEGVHLLYDYTGRASGEAFVHFVDKGSAQEALERDREKIGHRYIEVFPSSAEEVRTYGSRDNSRSTSRTPRPTPYDRGDRYTQRFSRGRGYGRAARRSGPSPEGSGYSRGGFRRGSHCVHMRGLPFKATPQDIAYFFKPVRPVNINILYDNSGRPSGEADVEFECHEDAVRAMRRDKHNMDHRYIELFLNSSSSGGGGGGGSGGSSGGGTFKPNRNFRNNY